jgi:hypothetical protein
MHGCWDQVGKKQDPSLLSFAVCSLPSRTGQEHQTPSTLEYAAVSILGLPLMPLTYASSQQCYLFQWHSLAHLLALKRARYMCTGPYRKRGRPWNTTKV